MPVTSEQHGKSLDGPALCEQLPVRDYLDDVMVRTNGSLVAGYEVRGITSYFASDEERDRVRFMGGGCFWFGPRLNGAISSEFQRLRRAVRP